MFHLQFGRFSGSRSRYGWLVQLSLMIGLLITAMLITVPAVAASEQKPQQKHTLTLNKKWIGDFDGMVTDRIIIYKYYIAYSMIVSQMEKKEQLRKKK